VRQNLFSGSGFLAYYLLKSVSPMRGRARQHRSVAGLECNFKNNAGLVATGLFDQIAKIYGELIMRYSVFSKMRLPMYVLALSFLVVSVPQEVRADKLSAPQAMVQKISDRMQQALKGKPSSSRAYGLVNKIIVPYINFNMVAKRALGKTYWGKASAGQRSRFVSQFKKLLVRTYSSAFASYNTWDMQQLGTKKSGKSVAVKTRVSPAGTSSVSVTYLMYGSGSSWKVYDIYISGVSLAKSHSASFQGIVKTSGMEGLIKQLGSMNKG
jgi:phospholipid transport system substrate-binding protein